MKKIGSVLLACVLMLTALTGCGGENSSSMAEVDKSSLTVGYISKNTTYDPAQITAHMQLYVLLCCMDRLVGVNPETGDAEYYLAKSHTESEDGLEWTFELRDDVYFSNGEKLTAKDVKYSLETIMASPYMSDNVSFIRSVEVIDDLHVKLNLKEYTNGAWSLLDYVLIFPADYYEEVGGDGFSDAPIGSGPYVVTKMDIATGNIELTRNENYWGDAPAIEHINFRYISSSDTALISLEKGEIDLCEIPATSYNTAAANSNLTIGQGPDDLIAHVIYNFDVYPTSELLFRQAIAYALDYESINAVAGNPQENISSVFWLDIWGDQPEGLTKYEYNPEKATQLLDEMGLERPYDLGTISVLAAGKSVAEVMQQNLSAVGINIGIEQVEVSSYIGDLLNGNYVLSIMQGNAPGAAASTALRASLHSENIGSMNIARYHTDEMDRMLEELDAARDDAVYQEKLTEVMSTLQDEEIYGTLYTTSPMYAYNNQLNANIQEIMYFPSYSWK